MATEECEKSNTAALTRLQINCSYSIYAHCADTNKANKLLFLLVHVYDTENSRNRLQSFTQQLCIIRAATDFDQDIYGFAISSHGTYDYCYF